MDSEADPLNLRPASTPTRTRSGKIRTPPSNVKLERSQVFPPRIPTTPPSSPVKSTRVTRSSPIKPPPRELSPTKKRPRKPRTPTPVPDSESESEEPEPENRAPSSPIPFVSRQASSPSPVEPGPHEEALDSPLTPLTSSKFSNLPRCLNAQKREILRSIQHPPAVLDEDEESANHIALKQLSDLLQGTITRGEGNSCLLIGPRGSGKTRIVNQCIADLSERPIVLRLCGWSQQSDRLAMREIAYQLSQQTGKSFLAAADEEEVETEHPTEEPNAFLETPNPVTMSLPPATHLPALISLIPTLSRPTVVILDAFDLFALHPRQSLLYCLLDTVQSCRAGAGSKGIAVIGMTTRVDTINLLEKRVKSRFSGRMLRTAPPSQTQDWVELTRAILGSRIKNHMELDATGGWQQQWEAGVQYFLDEEGTASALYESFSVTRDVRVLARLLTSVAIQLSPSSPFPTSKHLLSAVAAQRSRLRFPMLHTLPFPSICLLIACLHAETAGQPTFTFEMLYEKVRDQIRVSTSAPVEFNGRSIGMPKCPRPAFESLVSARIIAPAATPSVSVAKEFIKFRAVVSREDVKKAVEKKNDTVLTQWLKKAQ
ncbi:origin recognition complex subunit 4 C-terminus-domain-containing protein [Mycena maculata]|uniref:Origin recognition complex subunit 4 C-terminus-domain-containing protein n=1 Tax=Mycena maculata TaxID=230809 RepID=A0AAD7JTF2_9AGAR|nr:origin recognition complex subunit 4 C-terminus-domain-containing protein [Mycena maculata]